MEYARLSDLELLEVVYGAEALELWEACGRNLGNVLRETTTADSPGNQRLHACRELVARALASDLQRQRLGSPKDALKFFQTQLYGQPFETFWGVFLDAQNQVRQVEELFRGTLTQTSVFPREVVRLALRYQSDGVIFAHNHPSGVADPSLADQQLTQVLKSALALVDVRVLDHLVVADGRCVSFAERGLL